jgi:uncharacterized glyoxalase superfamily protein PhnB
MTDELESLRQLRPDHLLPVGPIDAKILAEQRARLLGNIDPNTPADSERHMWPTITARLAYRDIRAALEFLTTVFGFRELRASRMEHPEGMLTWLALGDGVLMISEDGPARHDIYSPVEAGKTTVMINVYVTDIEAHHARAVQGGARVVLELSDTFWGERRYEALDLEGHRWHFAERLSSVRRRTATGGSSDAIQ